MKPERVVLIWSVWAQCGHLHWRGKYLVVPLARKFSVVPSSEPARPLEFEELRFEKRHVGGFVVIECEGLVVHDARVVA